MDFDLIIIDCEGTLLDCEALRARVLAAAFADLGAWVPKAMIAAALPGRSLSEAARAVAGQCDIALPAGFTTRCAYGLKARCLGQVRPSAGIGRVLEMLKVPFCLTASSDPIVAEALIGAAGLEALTPRLVGLDCRLAPWPAPDRLADLAARRGVAPSRILLIDDSPSAMIAGLAAGMSTLLYAANAAPEQRAAWSGTGTLDHWDDLPHELLWPEATARVC